MKLLRRGARGPRVMLLQRLLNNDYGGSVLGEDGAFGPKTLAQLRTFQSSRRLHPDGAVGPITWRALDLTIDIEHPVTLVPQPNNVSCWSAAATMLFGSMSVGPGSASAPGGGLAATDTNVRTFARAQGLTFHAPMTRPIRAFADMMRRGPLWAAGRQPLGAPGARQSTHAVVVGAMWGDGTAGGTMLLIYDPWPPGIGSIYGVFYGERLAGSPLGMNFLLSR